MSKKILVISTSLRVDSNSDMLAEAFINGARQVGHEVEKVSLKDKTIGFCRGCLVCQKTGNCVIQDDANEIVKKMLYADVLVFATPIYCFGFSSQKEEKDRQFSEDEPDFRGSFKPIRNPCFYSGNSHRILL